MKDFDEQYMHNTRYNPQPQSVRQEESDDVIIMVLI